MWCKVSHNGFEVPPPRIDVHLGSKVIEPRNPPSLFSAFIPTVGQMNQSHRRPHSALMMNERYPRYGKVYHLLNSNPRPGSHFSMPIVKLPAASQQRSSPYLAVNTSASATKPVPRISITPEKSSSSAETAKELHTTRDVVQDILDSLTLLTGKVDTMLSRLDHLESRLSGPPHPSHYFEPRPSNHEPSYNTEPVKYGRTTEPGRWSAVHHNDAFNGEPQGPERTLAPPSEQFTLAASMLPLVPSSTTAVESVLPSPKYHRPPGGTQSSSSLSTIEMPYQVTHFTPPDDPQNQRTPVVAPTSTPHSSSAFTNRPVSTGRLGLASIRTSSGDRLNRRGPERPSLLKTGYCTLSQSFRTQPSRQPNVSQPVSTSGDWHSGTTRESPVGTNSPTGQTENGTRRSPSRTPAVRERNVGRPPPSTLRWTRSPRFYKPIMFRPMEPLDCGTNNNSLVEPVINNHPSDNSESYLTQVDRISSIRSMRKAGQRETCLDRVHHTHTRTWAKRMSYG
ncbi:unnamed protein product [Dicrocoelium dendriticum]|nr:unnamed protein product [Dicrocoelium dendriticum]